jgi:hypothetical protein
MKPCLEHNAMNITISTDIMLAELTNYFYVHISHQQYAKLIIHCQHIICSTEFTSGWNTPFYKNFLPTSVSNECFKEGYHKINTISWRPPPTVIFLEQLTRFYISIILKEKFYLYGVHPVAWCTRKNLSDNIPAIATIRFCLTSIQRETC